MAAAVRRRPRGSQLIEVMVAVTLVALVVAALLGVFPTAYASLAQARTRLEAEALASSMLEDRRTWAWDELEPGSHPLEPVGMFRPLVEVLEVDGRPPEDLKEVRVTLSWEERGEERRLVQSLLLVNLRG